jgi:hypothetical protein
LSAFKPDHGARLPKILLIQQQGLPKVKSNSGDCRQMAVSPVDRLFR